MTWVRYEPRSKISENYHRALSNIYGGDSFDRRGTTYSKYKTDEQQQQARCQREYDHQAKPSTSVATGISLGPVLPIRQTYGPLRRLYQKSKTQDQDTEYDCEHQLRRIVCVTHLLDCLGDDLAEFYKFSLECAIMLLPRRISRIETIRWENIEIVSLNHCRPTEDERVESGWKSDTQCNSCRDNTHLSQTTSPHHPVVLRSLSSADITFHFCQPGSRCIPTA